MLASEDKKVVSLIICKLVSNIEAAVMQGCRFDLWKINGGSVCMDEAYQVVIIKVVMLDIISPESIEKNLKIKIPGIVSNINLCI